MFPQLVSVLIQGYHFLEEEARIQQKLEGNTILEIESSLPVIQVLFISVLMNVAVYLQENGVEVPLSAKVKRAFHSSSRLEYYTPLT